MECYNGNDICDAYDPQVCDNPESEEAYEVVYHNESFCFDIEYAVATFQQSKCFLNFWGDDSDMAEGGTWWKFGIGIDSDNYFAYDADGGMEDVYNDRNLPERVYHTPNVEEMADWIINRLNAAACKGFIDEIVIFDWTPPECNSNIVIPIDNLRQHLIDAIIAGKETDYY